MSVVGIEMRRKREREAVSEGREADGKVGFQSMREQCNEICNGKWLGRSTLHSGCYTGKGTQLLLPLLRLMVALG